MTAALKQAICEIIVAVLYAFTLGVSAIAILEVLR